jgi:hypothetical protein
MARLYRQHVLKEDPNLVSIGSLKGTVKKAAAPGPAGVAPR